MNARSITTVDTVSTVSTVNTAAPFSETDEQFFRLVQSLFSPAFVFGASVLLASYDDEDSPYVPVEQVRTGETTPPVRV
jgi:hypothetical protein